MELPPDQQLMNKAEYLRFMETMLIGIQNTKVILRNRLRDNDQAIRLRLNARIPPEKVQRMRAWIEEANDRMAEMTETIVRLRLELMQQQHNYDLNLENEM